MKIKDGIMKTTPMAYHLLSQVGEKHLTHDQMEHTGMSDEKEIATISIFHHN